MEKELQMRGGGHEDEIQLRLLFEGKLNRLFAQYRSLETSHKQLQDRFKEL